MLNLQDLTISELQAYRAGMQEVAMMFEQERIKTSSYFSTRHIEVQRLIDLRSEEMENSFNDDRSYRFTG